MDRNPESTKEWTEAECRLPRGGRGSQHAWRSRSRAGGGVASREGGVDRNYDTKGSYTHLKCVASREGGVDRNTHFFMIE